MIKDLFSETDKQIIINAIKEAELNTSGEIRVHVDQRCKNPLDSASDVFAKLNMHQTALRNGVLFYLAIKDRKFAIIGDAGINSVVPAHFWDQITTDLELKFKNFAYVDGLKDAILATGMQLKTHFPYNDKSDINELSDEISFGNN